MKITLSKNHESDAYKNIIFVDDITINFDNLFITINEKTDDINIFDMQRYINITKEYLGDVYFNHESVQIIIPAKYLYSVQTVQR